MRECICENSSVVEHDLAKVGVAGSNPVSRSSLRSSGGIGRHAGLKILWALARAGSSPASSTKALVILRLLFFLKSLVLGLPPCTCKIASVTQLRLFYLLFICNKSLQ